MNAPENFAITTENFLNPENLHNLTEAYPYFSPGQFFLLDHYKKNNPLFFNRQAPLTALFFTNMNWLTWQLNFYSHKKDLQTDASQNKTEERDLNATNKIQETTDNSVSSTKNSEELIAFEPLHTIDYFASQGIKLTDVPITNDKLGRQMKSFTEWLKSMKKIHAEKVPMGDEQTDRKIQNIAEASNIDTEVVTEAMAEVLVKQEKKEKAIEMYEKLSLINPAKSAYFATRIKSLSADR